MSEFTNDISSNQPATTGSHVGTFLVRFLVPVHVLIGAIFKFLDASPDMLPTWIQSFATDGRLNFSSDPMLLPVEQAEFTLMTLLKIVLCIELIAVGIMFFIKKLARITAIVILVAFIFVLVAELLHLNRASGRTLLEAAFSNSCGCYGSTLPISLGVMLFIDLALLGGVLMFRPRTKVSSSDHVAQWPWVTMIIWLIGSLALGSNPIQRTNSNELTWQEKAAIFWVDKPFEETPLMQYLDMFPSDFGPVKQTWILYRESCSMCHELFDSTYSGDLGDQIVVAVRIPKGPDEIRSTPDEPINCPDCQMASLREGVQHPYSSPIIIRLDEEGVIREVIDPQLSSAGPGFHR